MFVSDLTTEKLVGNNQDGNLIENPNWSQIQAAITELDGKNQTLVTLGADDDTYMSIGGGSGKYVVTATFDNLNFYTLVDLSKSKEVEKLVVGGQSATYPGTMCVDLLRSLLAARTFALSGQLDELLVWQQDSSLAAA